MVASSSLEAADRVHFGRWDQRRDELLELAGPVLQAPAVQRLGSITFLGILSPRFAGLCDGRTPTECLLGDPRDGSRLSHSMGVALLCIDVARNFGFSTETQRYAAVWGLLHDLGNWPLAHTGEHAFRQLTGTTTRALRRDLITGDKRTVPSELILRQQLGALGLDLKLLMALMEYRLTELPPDLRTLAEVMQSPLSPDAFEGMWRCGAAIGAHVADPEHLAGALERSKDGTVQVRPGNEALVLAFWRSKVHIYRTFINHPEAIQLESAWSQAILRELAGLTPADSLRISEQEVISRVLSSGLPSNPPCSRYKPPVGYELALPSDHHFPANATMAQVADIFVSKPLHV